MRRVGLATAVAFGIVLLSGSAALATPNPSPGPSDLAIPVPPAQTPTTLCTISTNSSGAINLTGLVATKNGYAAVDGRNSSGWPKYVVHLNSNCVRTSLTSYPTQANDPQDLQIDSAGTLWVADTGDPAPSSRPTIALWKVPTSGPITLYHFSYPDGPHQSEAMVLDGDGRPIFVTQPSSGDGKATLYEPAPGALKTGVTMPLTNVGSFSPEQTGTSNKLSIPGNLLVTGGASAPGGTKVVLRTYSDAYEWTVSGGNVAEAINKTKPIITPLPNESQGEAIAFTSDGKDFVTVSNVSTATPILKWTPAAAVAPSKKAKAPAGPKKRGAISAWIYSLSLTQLQLILAGIAVFGALLIGLGIMGILRSRRRQAVATSASRARPMGPRPDSARAPIPAGGPIGGPGGGVYGAPARPGGAPGGNVYGGAPASGGNVYGGGGNNNVYGSPGGPPRSGGGGVYGAPREAPDRGYDPYTGDRPGGNRYGAPPPAGPPGGRSGGGQQGGGQQSGGQQSGGQQSGGQQSGGQYGGGQYGAPADPYDGAPDFGGRGASDDRRRPPAYPDEYPGDYPR